MKPYIEHKGSRIYLPQEVKPHNFEMNVMELNGKTFYLLCPKVKTRYMQATGGLMELEGKELKFAMKGRKIAQATFPLGQFETLNISIDHKAAAATPVSMESDHTSESESTEPNA